MEYLLQRVGLLDGLYLAVPLEVAGQDFARGDGQELALHVQLYATVRLLLGAGRRSRRDGAKSCA